MSLGVPVNASLLDTRPPDATGTRVPSEVWGATPVLPSGRRCSRPAGREEQRYKQIGLAAGRRAESRAEGEAENRRSRKSTERRESGLGGQRKDS